MPKSRYYVFQVMIFFHLIQISDNCKIKKCLSSQSDVEKERLNLGVNETSQPTIDKLLLASDFVKNGFFLCFVIFLTGVSQSILR